MFIACACRKDGVQAAYRNDQRQEYVNNLAYKHGTGLGTAPWYGVPGTAYDFGFAKSNAKGPTYDTDPSHPTGYGYEAPVAQYHSQPAYGHSDGYKAYKAGYKEGLKAAGDCSSQTEPYNLKHAKSSGKYPATAQKIPAAYTNVIGTAAALDHGRYHGTADVGYTGNGRYQQHKVAYDDLKQPAGYISGSYEAVGYGYMYWTMCRDHVIGGCSVWTSLCYCVTANKAAPRKLWRYITQCSVSHQTTSHST